MPDHTSHQTLLSTDWVLPPFSWLMKDMQQISIKQFVQINESVENVSKQLTGWQKAMS